MSSHKVIPPKVNAESCRPKWSAGITLIADLLPQ